MFDKKQKSCVKRIHLVTDDGLYDRKAFYSVKIVFLFILYARVAMLTIFHFETLVAIQKKLKTYDRLSKPSITYSLSLKHCIYSFSKVFKKTLNSSIPCYSYNFLDINK